MIIRPARLSDRSAIMGIAEEQMGRYPKLRPDRSKTYKLLTEAISSARHFVHVASDSSDRIHGVIVGLTGDNLWAQRQNCNISLWVSNTPGAGAELLREFKRWIRTRRGIKVAGMSPDLELDPRVLTLAERIGFERNGGSYLLYN